MVQQSGRSRWVSGFAIAALVMGAGGGAIAQIIPDNTLGTQVFGVCTGTGGTCGITGGSQRGANLFHSFQQFSLPNGDLAGFIVAPTVQNAIVWVTGQGTGFVSNINGTIVTFNQTNTGFPPSQPINFFLLNPNGIVFGPNAALFVGGSFLATTAERMQFQDGTVFNARDPAPLLTVNVPVGLQMGQTPGAIHMQSSRLSAGVTDIFTNFVLVGGDVSLDNTLIVTLGQQIDVGALAAGSSTEFVQSGSSL
jgi:filamentous hemagglutinin family protein